MNLPQLKARTSELAWPKEVYDLKEPVIKKCSTCQENKPPRSKTFSDFVFIEHLELKYKDQVYAVFLAPDGATHLVWARPQSTMQNEDA